MASVFLPDGATNPLVDDANEGARLPELYAAFRAIKKDLSHLFPRTAKDDLPLPHRRSHSGDFKPALTVCPRTIQPYMGRILIDH